MAYRTWPIRNGSIGNGSIRNELMRNGPIKRGLFSGAFSDGYELLAIALLYVII